MPHLENLKNGNSGASNTTKLVTTGSNQILSILVCTISNQNNQILYRAKPNCVFGVLTKYHHSLEQLSSEGSHTQNSSCLQCPVERVHVLRYAKSGQVFTNNLQPKSGNSCSSIKIMIHTNPHPSGEYTHKYQHRGSFINICYHQSGCLACIVGSSTPNSYLHNTRLISSININFKLLNISAHVKIKLDVLIKRDLANQLLLHNPSGELYNKQLLRHCQLKLNSISHVFMDYRTSLPYLKSQSSQPAIMCGKQYLISVNYSTTSNLTKQYGFLPLLPPYLIQSI